MVTAELQAAAEAQGMFYPPDPASVNFCTIGGNAAENAGGLRAVKYGVTRDYVLALRAVLPDGRVFRTGKATMKSVVGYDLTRLIVGSEGTLAIITELTLRLLPKPEAKATVSALFGELEQGAEAVQAVLRSGILPTALEFIDRTSLLAVDAYIGLGLPKGTEAMVLIDVDGAPEVVPGQAERLARVLTESGGQEVKVALDPSQAAELWRARRAMGPAVFHLAPSKFNEDVAVPLGRLAEVLRAIEEIGRHRGLPIPTFGHAGDGNLHVNVMYDAKQPDQLKAAHQAVSDVFAKVLSVGGTLSGEHGVGTCKLGYVGAEDRPRGPGADARRQEALRPGEHPQPPQGHPRTGHAALTGAFRQHLLDVGAGFIPARESPFPSARGWEKGKLPATTLNPALAVIASSGGTKSWQ